MLIAWGALLSFAVFGVWLFALFDVVTAPVEEIRALQKPLWVVIVLLGFIVGAVAWFMLGRPRREGAGPGSRGAAFGGSRPGTGGWHGVGARPEPVAPDDDPDFLRSLRPNRPDEDGPPAKA